MTEDKEPFLSRWSRLKIDAREAPRDLPAEPPAAPPAKADESPAPLPKVEELTPESDFRPFMDAKVEPGTRREALKKLFADPHFNVPDPFEAYSEDYTKGEPIPLEMLKTLNQARRLLFDDAETKAAQAGADQPAQPPQETTDGAGKQDA